MKNFPALFKGCFSRSKGILTIAAVVSIAIALLIISILNTSDPELIAIKLGFVDRDRSSISADFERYLTDDLGIVLVYSDNIDEMNTSLVEKRISGIIEIPSGFEAALLSGKTNPILLTFMGDYANEAFTRGYIDSYTQSLGVLSMMAGNDAAALSDLLEQTAANNIPVKVTEKEETLLKAETDKDSYRIMISFFMMFSFIMSISIATMLFSDRMAGTYRRIKAGRVTSFEYVLSVAVIGAFMMLLINGPSLVIYALSGSDPGVPYAATAGLIAVFSIFVVAFGLLIGLVMPSNGSIIAVMIAVTTISSMLGGAWFPVDLAPRAFQVLGYVTPQHWFFEAVNAWQTGAGNPAGPTLIIVLAAALCFVLAGIQFTVNKSLSRI